MARRFEMTDAEWERVAPLLPGKAGDPGRTAADNRQFVDAALWILRTGRPGGTCRGGSATRARPASGFPAGAKRESGAGCSKRSAATRTLEAVLLDSTIVRAHTRTRPAEQGGAGARPWPQSGRLRDETPLRHRPARAAAEGGGHRRGAERRGRGRRAAGGSAHRALAPAGDRGSAYDLDRTREATRAAGAEPVIPPRRHRRVPISYDGAAYKWRNAVERFVGRLKQCRRIATRYEKTARNFLGFVHLACLLNVLK